MSKTAVMSVNQAIARGFWEAGGRVATSYPGSPTVQIMESLLDYPDMTSRWAINEKVALEVAIGASIAGARSLVSMKHVGVNIAADPLMTFTQVETVGGFVLVVGDDPGLSSSQNEQDTRFFTRFANIPLLEPSTAQEAKDYVDEALVISEQWGTPVIIRLTSTLCHSQGVVQLGQRRDEPVEGFNEDQARFCMLPPYSRDQQHFMQQRMAALRELSEVSPLQQYEESSNLRCLIITSGISYQHLQELGADVSILKLGMSYPLPVQRIGELAALHQQVIVLEELMPFVEDELKAAGLAVEGKRYFSFTGELTPDDIRTGLIQAGVIPSALTSAAEDSHVVGRTPILCAGCPHRPIFHILKQAQAVVIGDIGCYSLGILEPFEVLKTNLSMGASLGMIQGVALAQRMAGNVKPLVATIGDGTFFHSGLSGLADLVNTRENITLLILDNRTTAMTGGQMTPTTRDFVKDEDLTGINLPELLRAFGVEDVQVVNQFHYDKTRRIIVSAMEHQGLSVIIATRPCALNFKLRYPHYYVDSDLCISCRQCIAVNCPPISMRAETGTEEKRSFIDPDMCVGCSVCSQVCPVKAIKSSRSQEV